MVLIVFLIQNVYFYQNIIWDGMVDKTLFHKKIRYVLDYIQILDSALHDEALTLPLYLLLFYFLCQTMMIDMALKLSGL